MTRKLDHLDAIFRPHCPVDGDFGSYSIGQLQQYIRDHGSPVLLDCKWGNDTILIYTTVYLQKFLNTYQIKITNGKGYSVKWSQ